MEMAVRIDRGNGPAIVLLHGFPGSAADWEPVAVRLPEDRRTLVVDLVGFGASARPESFEAVWTDAQAAALCATLDRLGMDEVALIGHDMGGPVALTFLDRYPDRVTHLGLSATNTFTDTPVDFPLSLLRLPGLGALHLEAHDGGPRCVGDVSVDGLQRDGRLVEKSPQVGGTSARAVSRTPA